jgi:hypothetical protein
MYLKLFAVMGGLWIMEFASWITDQNDGIWYFFDICNCLRGLWLLIFCVLLSKRVRVGVRRSLSMSMQNSDSKSSHNRNPTALTSTSIEKEQVEMHEITLPTASISTDEN